MCKINETLCIMCLSASPGVFAPCNESSSGWLCLGDDMDMCTSLVLKTSKSRSGKMYVYVGSIVQTDTTEIVCEQCIQDATTKATEKKGRFMSMLKRTYSL